MNWREKLGDLIETVAFAMAYSPDAFPVRDFRPPDGQMNLEKVFEEMRDEFEVVAKGKGETAEIAQCRLGIEEAYWRYCRGDKIKGLLKLQEVYHILLEL